MKGRCNTGYHWDSSVLTKMLKSYVQLNCFFFFISYDVPLVDNSKSTQNITNFVTGSSLFPPISANSTDLYFVTHAHINRFFFIILMCIYFRPYIYAEEKEEFENIVWISDLVERERFGFIYLFFIVMQFN
jgi:hypothetical protein